MGAAAAVLNRRFPPNGMTYRGGGFDNAHRGFFIAGKKYRVPGFLATSFSEAKAREFIFNNATAMARQGILWVVHVDPQARTTTRTNAAEFIELLDKCRASA